MYRMRKRKNKKLRRKIELLVKMCLLVIGVLILIPHNMNKKASQPVSPISENSSSSTAPIQKIITVPEISQEGIPTGCESASTAALLQYWNVDMDANTFIEEYLPCQDFYYKNGVLYGANPHEAFAGNPYSRSSLGCYPEVIMTALHSMQDDSFAGTTSLAFQNISNMDLQTLCNSYVKNDIPVLLWITIDLKEPVPGMQYHLEDGSLYTWMKHEHCVVLCGYDEDSYYYMDPLSDGNIVMQDKELVELRYEQLGRYALAINRK